MTIFGQTIADLANWVAVLTPVWMAVSWIFTRKRFMEFWKRSKRLLFFVASGAVFVGAYRFGWLSWLVRDITIPMWLLILLCAFAVFVILGACFAAYRSHRAPSQRDYVKARIFDIDWEWEYEHGEIQEWNMGAFCPKDGCHCRLEPVLSSAFSSSIRDVDLVCSNCGFTKGFERSWDHLKHLVALEIERRLRTGEFSKFLKHDRR